MPHPFANRREIRASRGQVFAAADRALKFGRRPTQDGVRTDLGGGSLNSINTYLNEWYQDLGSRLSKSEEPVKGVPSEASDLLLQLWRLAIKTTGAGKATDAESVELRIMRSQRDAAMAQASALQTLNAELTRHRTTAERSLAEARALLMRREASLEEEREARQQVDAELVRARLELEVWAAKKSVTRLTRSRERRRKARKASTRRGGGIPTARSGNRLAKARIKTASAKRRPATKANVARDRRRANRRAR